MTENELIEKQRESGDSRFVVTRSGKFYSAYDCGAFALARATGYRVMRRQRKGDRFVLTTGFPESRLENVLQQIVAAGGIIERRGEDDFIFSGIDGSNEESLVCTHTQAKKKQNKKEAHGAANDNLRSIILSFDLLHSSPIEAMDFINSLQQQIRSSIDD